MIRLEELDFQHAIELRQTSRGKWSYIIHLQSLSSRPSVKFPTRELALAEASQLVAFMQ